MENTIIQDWLVQYKMSLNIQKSRVLWFHIGKRKKQQSYPSISINQTTLQPTERQKYLGLVFDSHLSWDLQVSSVCKKMSYYLHLIKLHSRVLNHHIMKLLIDSLVFSHLTYALPVWGTSVKQSLTQRLVRFQNRAVRLLYNLQRMDHVTEYYRYAEWLPLPQLVMYRSLCLMFYQYHCDYARAWSQ